MASKTDQRVGAKRLDKVPLYVVFGLGIAFWVAFGIINGVDWQHPATAGIWGEPVGWLTYLLNFAIWFLALAVAVLTGRRLRELYARGLAEVVQLLFFGYVQVFPVVASKYFLPVSSVALAVLLIIVMGSGKLERSSSRLADTQKGKSDGG